MSHPFQRIVRPMLWFAAAVLIAAPAALATDYSWNNSSGGLYEDGMDWTPGGIPSRGDTATFALNSMYTVQLAFQKETAINFVTGNVTLAPYLPLFSYSLTVDNGVSLPNTTGGSSLTLGSVGYPFGLYTNYLDLENGVPLYVFYGSGLRDNALGLTRAGSLNGTLLVSGSSGFNSSLGVYASDPISGHLTPAPPLLVGLNGGAGLLGFQDGGTGSIDGPLLIADDVSPGTGEVDVGGFRAGATLQLGGNLTMAAHNLAGQSATMFIDSTGSALTQTIDESGNATGITVGSPANGSAAIYVGTAVSGGTLSTGTNGLSVNKTGAVIIGSSSTTGTLNANGDVIVDGGLLQVFSGSAFNLAAGRTLHIKGGGTADFKSFDINGTSIDFVAGSLSYAGNLRVGTGGPLGADFILHADRQLTLTGTTTIDQFHQLALDGGALHSGASRIMA